ncbi:hypothetical protein [Thioalkalivibrio sp. ALE16]|uniref:hypothetical protein n=1 Tax=Thioalkalivibrio sp. ALE16 TaxID=1158172 RepID=UPI000372DBB4|nr:hypothetical protein [Thioalkalivibrio sp. ALE16]
MPRPESFESWLVEEAGYLRVRALPDGSYAGLVPLLYTVGLCLGVQEGGYTHRYCYEDPALAQKALDALESSDAEPLDGWVARRG